MKCCTPTVRPFGLFCSHLNLQKHTGYKINYRFKLIRPGASLVAATNREREDMFIEQDDPKTICVCAT